MSNEEDDYPLSYLFYVVGVVIVLILGAAIFLYLMLNR